MEVEQPKEESAPSQPTPPPSSQSKKPSRALYVPKQRHASKDNPQTQGEVKPRPRPRYTDKARKNAKNKKDKAGGGEAGGDSKPAENQEQLHDTDVQVNGQSASVEADVTAHLEGTSPQEENGEEESWDTLFNDDGDCLDPHLLEEVRSWCRTVTDQYTKQNLITRDSNYCFPSPVLRSFPSCLPPYPTPNPS